MYLYTYTPFLIHFSRDFTQSYNICVYYIYDTCDYIAFKSRSVLKVFFEIIFNVSSFQACSQRLTPYLLVIMDTSCLYIHSALASVTYCKMAITPTAMPTGLQQGYTTLFLYRFCKVFVLALWPWYKNDPDRQYHGL